MRQLQPTGVIEKPVLRGSSSTQGVQKEQLGLWYHLQSAAVACPAAAWDVRRPLLQPVTEVMPCSCLRLFVVGACRV